MSASFRPAFRGLLLLLFISVSGARAATFYVDPAVGKMTNAGTSSQPWSTLEAVFKAGKKFAGGDVIVLRNGYHGYPLVKGQNSTNVTIKAESGHTPKLRKLRFENASRWVVTGLDISPLHAGSTSYDKGAHVEAMATASHITIKDCRIRSVFSVSGWTTTEWLNRVGGAIVMRAPHAVITGNQIENVGHGIYVLPTGTYAMVNYNVIDTLRDDGLRGLGSYGKFEYNTVRNMYAINDNHDDGFQSYSTGADGRTGTSVVYNVEVRGNVFISYTDPKQPYKSAMQGIGLFDGMFENWIIENNVVVTDRWHGISIYGAVNCRIVNNTVTKNPINARAETPWIQIKPHKNGTPSKGNTVRNNITPKLNVSSTVAVIDSNLVTSAYTSLFVDFAKFDLHLKAGCAAVNQGALGLAPKVDADLRTRVAPYDIGAYEAAGSTSTTTKVADPAFSVPAGTYGSAQSVTLSTGTSGATIRFTTDGSTPNATYGTIYSGPISIAKTTTLKAVAYKSGLTISAVKGATYTITTAKGSSVAFEAEALQRTVSGATLSVKAEGGSSGGSLIYFHANGTGDTIEFTTGTVQAGTYKLSLRAKKGASRGQHSVKVDGKVVGGTVDHYAKTNVFEEIAVGQVTFSSTGTHKIRLTVTGKNAKASGYLLVPDRILLTAL